MLMLISTFLLMLPLQCFRTRLMVFKPLFKLISVVLLLLLVLNSPLAQASPLPTGLASLPTGNAITDPKALLRLSLPIQNSAVRRLQADIEDIANQLRGKRWATINSEIAKGATIVRDRSADLLASIPPQNQPQAQVILNQLQAQLNELQAVAESKNREQVLQKRSLVLDLVGDLEALMVQGFPFNVPPEYSSLPQLLGRATIALQTNKGELTLVVDGYSAPLTAGNFVDLVQRGFYDGLKFTRAEESYVLQAGDPPGKEEGFVDPKTGQYRAIPLEILIQGDKKPLYGMTLEDAGRYLDQPVLPFSAYGTLALARPSDDPNGGSSQFFFLLFEPELTPAGSNLLDGRYAVFGYVVEGAEVLRELRQGDQIISARVTAGAENLVTPSA
uniref:peptidylprolyl isomerase n=1 Tax=Cyanothece sp. (strain PCC 7425 / ATCC 29141) TaxID=395961 RepID=B8HMP1_CYAP4